MKRSLIIFALLLFAVMANAQSYTSPGIPSGTTSLIPTFRTKAATPDSLAQIWLAIGGNKFYRMLSGMDVIVFDAKVVQGLGTTSSKLTFRDTLLKPNWVINPADTLHPVLTLIQKKSQDNLWLKGTGITDGRAAIRFTTEKDTGDYEYGFLAGGDNNLYGLRNVRAATPPNISWVWSVNAHNGDYTNFYRHVGMTGLTDTSTAAKIVAIDANGKLFKVPYSGGGTTYTASHAVGLVGTDFRLVSGTLAANVSLDAEDTHNLSMQSNDGGLTTSSWLLTNGVFNGGVNQSGTDLAGFSSNASTGNSFFQIYYNAGLLSKSITLSNGLPAAGIGIKDNVENIGLNGDRVFPLSLGTQYAQYHKVDSIAIAKADSISGGGGGVNIYNSDGTLTSDRTLYTGGKVLNIFALNHFGGTTVSVDSLLGVRLTTDDFADNGLGGNMVLDTSQVHLWRAGAGGHQGFKMSVSGFIVENHIDSTFNYEGDYSAKLRRYDLAIPNWGMVKSRIDSAISGTTIHTSNGLSGDGSVGTPVVLGGTLSGNVDENIGANSIDWHGDNGTYAVDNLIDNTPGGSLISSQASNSAGSHYAAVNIGVTSPTGWYAELATNKSGSGASIQLDGNTGNTTITNTLGSFGAQYGADYSTALRLNPNGIASVKVVKDMADSVKGTISAGASPGNPSGLLTFTASNGSNSTYLRNDGLHAIDSTVVRSVANSYSLSGMQTKLNNYALTSALPVGANPTGTAGTSAVNGSATTFMRSDAAPKVDSAVFQTILNYFPKGDTRYLQKAATTLPSSFVNSSLTSVGTLGGLTVTAAPTFSAMTSGSVLFAGTSGLLSQNNANFFWDNTNKFLGIDTNAPSDFLHILAGTTSGGLTVEETNSGTHSPWVSVKKGTNQVFWSLAGATDSFFLGTSAGDMIFRATTGKNIWFGASDGSTAASLEIVSGGEIKAVAGDVNIATAGKRLKVAEGTNGFAGQTTLVSGTKAITITGVTTSSRAFCQLVTQGGTVTTTQVYGAVCTANTLTITALTTAGATDTTDTSVLNYFIVN